MKYILKKDLPGAKAWEIEVHQHLSMTLWYSVPQLIQEWFIEPIKEKSEWCWITWMYLLDNWIKQDTWIYFRHTKEDCTLEPLIWFNKEWGGKFYNKLKALKTILKWKEEENPENIAWENTNAYWWSVYINYQWELNTTQYWWRYIAFLPYYTTENIAEHAIIELSKEYKLLLWVEKTNN